MSVNLRSLIGKLNETTRNALEAAAGLCLSRTHYDVEIEHFLMKLLDGGDTDFACIIRHFGVDKSRLAAELTRSLDKLKSGNARTPAISPSVLKMLTDAWTFGSLEYDAVEVRSGFAILALASDEELARIMREASREFQKINGGLAAQGVQLHRGRIGRGNRHRSGRCGARGRRRAAGGAGQQDAQPGSIHGEPHGERAGRKDRSCAGARFRNPPGGRYSHPPPPEQPHPGRAKPASARPPWWRASPCAWSKATCRRLLRNVAIRTLDLALLQAGAGVKGEFENRLKGLIERGEVLAHRPSFCSSTKRTP